MTNPNDFDGMEEIFDAFLSGENDSLEGEQDALHLWEVIKNDRKAQAKYDAVVHAFRFLAGRKGIRSFGEDESTALWPLVMGGVAEGARQRSGLSKQALRHMAVPALVANISSALVNYSRTGDGEITFDTPAEGQTEPVQFSIASVGGEVSLRLYRNDEASDFVANVTPAEVTTNVDESEVDAWAAVSTALNTLSMMTKELLGDETLLNGRIEIKDGRAHVSLQPLMPKKANG